MRRRYDKEMEEGREIGEENDNEEMKNYSPLAHSVTSNIIYVKGEVH